MKLLMADLQRDETTQAGLKWQRWSYYSLFVRKPKNGSESCCEILNYTTPSSTAKLRFDAIFSSFQTSEAVFAFVFNITHFLTAWSYGLQVILSLK